MQERSPKQEAPTGRREAVLDAAMQQFARFGYRKTSMDDIARTARISRPGLYFLFDSKPVLFREAVTRSLTRDLDAIADVLADVRRPLRTRLLAAFERWAGSYVGPLTDEATGIRDADPALLGSVFETAPSRFHDLVATAIAEVYASDATDRARTLISASIGIKHQIAAPEQFSEPFETALDLIVGSTKRAPTSR